MKALGRKSKLRHITHNPTGELFKTFLNLLRAKNK